MTIWKEADGSNRTNTEIAASSKLPIEFTDARNPGGPFNELHVWNESDEDIWVYLDGMTSMGKAFPVQAGDYASVPKEDGTEFHKLVIENRDTVNAIAAGELLFKANRYDLVRA